MGVLTTSEIVAMAWDDQTSFDNIKAQSGLSEQDVIMTMRKHMKPSSFRMWRKRVSGRASKHQVKSRARFKVDLVAACPLRKRS